jgi:hypothetical protein
LTPQAYRIHARACNRSVPAIVLVRLALVRGAASALVLVRLVAGRRVVVAAVGYGLVLVRLEPAFVVELVDDVVGRRLLSGRR